VLRALPAARAGTAISATSEMSFCSRRTAFWILAGIPAALATAATAVAQANAYVAAAFKMKADAEKAGDQPYGAVVVHGDEIVGWGPSRVVTRNDPTAHAEREAIRDAQRRLGKLDLSGSMLYSTSRPCSLCERAAAEAKVARMIHGVSAIDAGAPRL
jgi:tRNA(Arg) A34 adenosine deaminase TadA